MTACNVDLNRASRGIGSKCQGSFVRTRPINNIKWKNARCLKNLFFHDLKVRRRLGSRNHLRIRLAFIAYRRAACATETPNAHVCPQIETFPSSD